MADDTSPLSALRREAAVGLNETMWKRRFDEVCLHS